ncbi:MAG: ester cyclase [Candidatus Hodarchaeota archaeon]
MKKPVSEETVIQFFKEHWDRPSVIRELSTSGLIVHWPWGQSTTGADKIASSLEKNRNREDYISPKVIFDDIFSYGDRVAFRFHAITPDPNGRNISKDEIGIARMIGEKIAEIWVSWDRQYLSEQKES